jgi:outer membrane protein
MTKILSRLTLALIIAVSAGLNLAVADTTPVSTPVKIGVIDINQLLAGSAKAKAIGDQLKKEFQTREGNLVATDKTIKDKETKLERNKTVMGEVERSKLEKEIYAAKRDFARMQAEFREDTGIRQREETEKFFKEVRVIIKDVAVADKFNLIVSAEAAPYFDTRVNITEKVLKKLNQKS